MYLKLNKAYTITNKIDNLFLSCILIKNLKEISKYNLTLKFIKLHLTYV